MCIYGNFFKNMLVCFCYLQYEFLSIWINEYVYRNMFYNIYKIEQEENDFVGRMEKLKLINF